jgi:putative flippase GtrA
MWRLALVPFALQALAIGVDEIGFHLKRGLPRWERIGHPLDTLTVLACLLYALWVPYSQAALGGYVALAIFSSLFVTKDEFVHKHHCPAAEQWLHALLFTLHPVVLGAAGCIWVAVHNASPPPWLAAWLDNPNALRRFLVAQTGAMGLFIVYQITYWNFLWKKRA